MFKKIKIKEILVIGLGIFATCFVISKFVLCKFGMQSDFLSASGTLFAAATAVYLYNDWREPFFIEKIESNQKEIRKAIRGFKHSMVYFLSIIQYENFNPSKLNNDNSCSLEYKKRLNDLLDKIDDLVSEIKNYESIVKIQNSDSTTLHLSSIHDAEAALTRIFNILNKYDLHKDYCESYKYIRCESSKIGFEMDVRALTEKFHEDLFNFFSGLVQNEKGH